MSSQIFLRTVIRNWLALSCVYRSSRGDFLCTSSRRSSCEVPIPYARNQDQIVIQPIFMLHSTICQFYLEDLRFSSAFWLPWPSHLLKLGRVPWLAVIIKVVKISTSGSQMRIKMCVFSAKYSIACDVCKAHRDRSFFVYILRREKSPLATFSPKWCYHTTGGAACQTRSS